MRAVCLSPAQELANADFLLERAFMVVCATTIISIHDCSAKQGEEPIPGTLHPAVAGQLALQVALAREIKEHLGIADEVFGEDRWFGDLLSGRNGWENGL